MDILIIGAAGFIGKSAVIYYQKKGYRVFGADIVACPYLAADNFWLLDPQVPDFDQVFQQFACGVCINAAGAANVQISIQKPAFDFDLNTNKVLAILSSLQKFRPACKFINLSSAAVYGNPVDNPIRESFSPQPLSPYGYHKWMSEIICKEFSSCFGIATCSLRIFSVYGPFLNKQLFWDLYQKFQNDPEVALFGTGKESRDFIYIDDLLQVFDLIIARGNFQGEAINVANGEEVTIEQAVKVFAHLLHAQKPIRFSGAEKVGDPVNWCAHIETLQELGYQRRVSFSQGLQHYIDWLNCKEKND